MFRVLLLEVGIEFPVVSLTNVELLSFFCSVRSGLSEVALSCGLGEEFAFAVGNAAALKLADIFRKRPMAGTNDGIVGRVVQQQL